MAKKISIRQCPSPENPTIAFPSKNLAVLDISRFTFCKVDYKLPDYMSQSIGRRGHHDSVTFKARPPRRLRLRRMHVVCVRIYRYMYKSVYQGIRTAAHGCSRPPTNNFVPTSDTNVVLSAVEERTAAQGHPPHVLMCTNTIHRVGNKHVRNC